MKSNESDKTDREKLIEFLDHVQGGASVHVIENGEHPYIHLDVDLSHFNICYPFRFCNLWRSYRGEQGRSPLVFYNRQEAKISYMELLHFWIKDSLRLCDKEFEVNSWRMRYLLKKYDWLSNMPLVRDFKLRMAYLNRKDMAERVIECESEIARLEAGHE